MENIEAADAGGNQSHNFRSLTVGGVKNTPYGEVESMMHSAKNSGRVEHHDRNGY